MDDDLGAGPRGGSGRGFLQHGRALVVVAHPDDETFGLGAVIDLLTSNGMRVGELCFTRGEASTLGAAADLAARRPVELRAACTVLGIDDLTVVGLPDGHVAETAEATLDAHVDAALNGASLLVVFERLGITRHPDHSAATAAAMRAARRRDLATLEWGLEPRVATALRGEFSVPFSAIDGAGCVDLVVNRARQRAAIDCHASQSADNPVLRRRLELQGDVERVRYTAGRQA